MLVLFTALATGALAGLVALPHCVAMCGPYAGFACAGPGGTSASRMDRALRYLGGRLAGYAVVGAVAGGTGGVAQAALPPSWAAVLLAVMLAGGMLSLAWRLARTERQTGLVALTPRRPEPGMGARAAESIQTWLASAVGLASRSPTLLGLVMATFPCGALYAALLVAASTASPWAGAASMLGFGLTSSAALGISGWIASASVALDRHTRLALSVALVLGAVVLVARPLLVLGTEAPAVCEHTTVAERP